MGKKKPRKSVAMQVHKKQQENAEKKRQEDAQAFVAEYQELVKKYNIKWTAQLQYQHNALKPQLILAEATPAQVTSWPEAQRQNLETRKECTHSIATPKDTTCETCGLEKKNWGSEGKGVTEEYETRKTKEIEEAGEKSE